MKKKTETTFWLARDDGTGIHYIGPTQMLKSRNSMGEFVFDSPLHDAWCIASHTLKLLGLPTLRKGQQVQLRRTPQGWEVVK